MLCRSPWTNISSVSAVPLDCECLLLQTNLFKMLLSSSEATALFAYFSALFLGIRVHLIGTW